MILIIVVLVLLFGGGGYWGRGRGYWWGMCCWRVAFVSNDHRDQAATARRPAMP